MSCCVVEVLEITSQVRWPWSLTLSETPKARKRSQSTGGKGSGEKRKRKGSGEKRKRKGSGEKRKRVWESSSEMQL